MIARIVIASLGASMFAFSVAAEPADAKFNAGAMFGCGEPGVVCDRAASTPAPVALDPIAVFQRVVDRYRKIESYKDSASVVQVTQRQGAESSRVETQINCEFAQGKLHVKTPTSQVRDGLGLSLPVKSSKEVRDAQLRYDLWLAPHMALKFTNQPMKELRAGVEEGFTATQAESVTIDNKKMIHVALRSGDGTSEDCLAKFDLYVNSDSMLIERIEGAQKLPDGASFSTTLRITPMEIADAAALEPAA